MADADVGTVATLEVQRTWTAKKVDFAPIDIVALVIAVGGVGAQIVTWILRRPAQHATVADKLTGSALRLVQQLEADVAELRQESTELKRELSTARGRIRELELENARLRRELDRFNGNTPT